MRQKLPWMEEAEQKMNTPLVFHKTDQAQGPCPQCERLDGNGGTDRLVVFEDGGWFCRGCKRVHDDHHPNRRYSGWWTSDRMTADLVKARKTEKIERAKEAYALMHKDQTWFTYHEAVKKDSALFSLWLDQGITEQSILTWGLGYCTETPCDDQKRPSLTIPVFYGAKLYDIRHRVIGGENGQKYRSHLPGLTPVYFNLDGIKGSNKVIIVEGEKKAIILQQEGFSPVVAYPGINYAHFLPSIIRRDGLKDQEFIFFPDPGSESTIEIAVQPLVKQGWICSIVDPIDKPDDFLIEYGQQVFRDVLEMRRKL